MARLIGPDMGSRAVFLPSGAPAAGQHGIVYADAAGTVLADIRVYDGTVTPGAAYAGSVVTVDAYGLLPLFWFPDGLDRVWIIVNGGPLVPIDADYNARLDTVTQTANAAETPAGAQAKAGAAQAAAVASSAQRASNLSDLASASTARTNLGLGGAATLNVGNTAGTVAAGNDSRITGAAQRSSLAVNVKDYGAVGNGVADDTAAIQAALAAVATGGDLLFPAGTYKTTQTLVMRSNMRWWGAGIGATKLTLANDANVDLIQTDSFATYTGGVTQNGPLHWAIEGMTLDGNGANQTGASWPLRIYGKCYQIRNVEIIGGYSGGVWSEWGTGGDDMEAQWSNFKIHHNLNGPGMDWRGPHDSQFVNGQVFNQDGQYGIHTSGNAGGEQFTNVHVWHFHTVAWYLEQNAKCANCVGEGAQVNVWINADRTIWDGDVFGTNGTGTYAGTEVGVRIGTAPATTKRNYIVRGTLWNWAAGDTPIHYAADGGGTVDVLVSKGSATTLTASTPSALSRINLACTDSPASTVTEQSTMLAALGYMDAAIETAPRTIDGSYNAVSGRVNLSYVTAYRTQTITKLGALSRNTAVAGLTAARWGLYTVAANGDLTLVARTAQNTTTAYTASFAEYVAALDTAGGFPASYTLEVGRRYALAQIVTFATTAPSLRGYATNLPGSTSARPPRLNGTLGGQTDLPTSITAGTIGTDGNAVYLFGLA